MDLLRNQSFVLDGQVSRLRGDGVELVVEDASMTLPLLLSWCHEQQIGVESASEHVPLFDDVFVKLIDQETAVVEEVDA